MKWILIVFVYTAFAQGDVKMHNVEVKNIPFRSKISCEGARAGLESMPKPAEWLTVSYVGYCTADAP